MPVPDVEGGRHLPLLRAVAHQPGVAAAAKRQREGVEQDRLARTGLASQHRKAAGKFEIETLDQHNVTDRQTRQHVTVIPTGQVLTSAPAREPTLRMLESTHH